MIPSRRKLETPQLVLIVRHVISINRMMIAHGSSQEQNRRLTDVLYILEDLTVHQESPWDIKSQPKIEERPAT